MATQVVTFAFASDAQSFTPSAGANTVGSWQSADGTPSNGCLQFRIDGKNKTNNNNTYSRTLTFEDMGVPAGSTITAINAASCYTKCREWNVGSGTGNQSDGVTLNPSGFSAIEIAAAGSAYTGTTTWAQQTGAGASGLSIPSSTSCVVTWQADLSTGSNNGAYVTIGCDLITFTVVYDPPTGYTLPVDPGALALAGQSTVMNIGTVATAGALQLTGKPMGTSQSFGVGALALAGAVVALGTSIAVEAGSLSLSGQDVSLRHTQSVSVEPAALTLSGQDVGLAHTQSIQVDPGTLVLSGQDVTLALTSGQSIAVDPAALTLSGQNVGLVHTQSIGVDAAALTFAGQNIGLVHTQSIAVDPAALTLSGQDVGFLHTQSIGVDAGALILSGQPVTLEDARFTDPGALVLAGQGVPLSVGLMIESGALVFSGSEISLVVAQNIILSGVASNETIGTHTLANVVAQNITYSGLAGGELFGSASVANASEQNISPTGFVDPDLYGSHTTAHASEQDISPTGLFSDEAIGVLVFGQPIQGIFPAGLVSSLEFGSLVVTGGTAPSWLGGWWLAGEQLDVAGIIGTIFLSDVTPVPPTAAFIGGFAHSPAGRRYICFWPGDNIVHYHKGIAVRSDGAMIVTTDSPDYYMAGFGVSARGELCVALMDSQLYNAGIGITTIGKTGVETL